MTTPPFTRRSWLATTLAAGCATAVLSMNSPLAFAAESAAPTSDNRLFELRIYVTNEGKLPDLLARFRDHTVKLFNKHGIENIGYWVPVEKEEGADNTLYYIIAHKSREGAEASWAAFRKDPDWQAAAKASEANGKILAQKPEVIFLKATDFSCPIKASAGAAGRVFELRTYTTPRGQVARAARPVPQPHHRAFQPPRQEPHRLLDPHGSQGLAQHQAALHPEP